MHAINNNNSYIDTLGQYTHYQIQFDTFTPRLALWVLL